MLVVHTINLYLDVPIPFGMNFEFTHYENFQNIISKELKRLSVYYYG